MFRVLILTLFITNAITDDSKNRHLSETTEGIDGNFQNLQNSTDDLDRVNEIKEEVKNISETTSDSIKRILKITREVFGFSENESLSFSLNINYSVSQPKRYPSTCNEALQDYKPSGVYKLEIPDSSLKPFEVYCYRRVLNHTIWTVIQRRQDSSVNFNETWESYKNGFGNLTGEHWLGLEKIHALTNQQKYKLLIEVRDSKNESRYFQFDYFKIGNEEQAYAIEPIGKRTENVECPNFHYNVTAKFSTFDNPNDGSRCLKNSGGAWWQLKDGFCRSDFNRKYDYNTGINWVADNRNQFSKYVQISISPNPW